MHFYYARNDALRRASHTYIAISDNDILFTHGWLEDCIEWLEKTPGKYLATPIKADWMNGIKPDRWKGDLNGRLLNQRAGSNIWVMRRADYEVIGNFEPLAVAGSKYVDKYVRMGYLMGVMPVPKAFDMAFRNGYNFNDRVVRKTL
jgi:glycosyltransferase involved in cell wall biosynthesis